MLHFPRSPAWLKATVFVLTGNNHISAILKKDPMSSKRKLQEVSDHPAQSIRRRVRRKTSTRKDHGAKDRILQLEREIFESRKNYNNIPKLITILKEGSIEDENVLPAAFSLGHIFKVLISDKKRVPDKDMPENEKVITQWLRNKRNEFMALLLERLAAQSSSSQV